MGILNRGSVLSVAAVILLSVSPRVLGADWPMMGRTASRNAVSPEKGPPVRWSFEEGKRSNIKWAADLGGRNCASPVVASGLVWVGTNNTRPRDPKESGDASVLMCFRESDGKFLWQYVSPRLDDEGQDFPRAAINCAPLAEDGRLYFTTNRAEVVCLNVRRLQEGKGEPTLLWKLDMRKEHGVVPVAPQCPGLGFTCSIGASYENRIYVITGNGVGPGGKAVPSPEAPSLLCLDRDTGKVLWKDSSPGKAILQSQWSSPLLIEGRGKAQVVVGQGDGWVRSFDGKTGELLWKFDANPKSAVWKPVRGTRNFIPATPVACDGKVYIASGHGPADSGGVGHLWCIDPHREPRNETKDISPVEDNFDPRAKVNAASGLVWHHGGPVEPAPRKGRPYHFGRTLSSVAVHEGLVIAPELEGYIDCLDARTGRKYWTHDVEEEILASPLIVDGKVYVTSTGGVVTVLSLSREKKVLAVNEVPEPINSGPVFANGVLFQATDSRLYVIRKGDDEKSP
jgi:outer membrane protein assembly factor BamB